MASTEHAVIVTYQLSDAGFGEAHERDAVHALTGRLADAIEAMGAGEFDGDEFGGGAVKLYAYGPDASRLFITMEPHLRAFPARPATPFFASAKREIRQQPNSELNSDRALVLASSSAAIRSLQRGTKPTLIGAVGSSPRAGMAVCCRPAGVDRSCRRARGEGLADGGADVSCATPLHVCAGQAGFEVGMKQAPVAMSWW